MCGIIGYTGSEDVKGVLLDALELLEYRGYDSAGIAVADTGLKQTKVYKCAGRVKDLRAICESEKLITECGIGHTRWATHGGVNDTNAHPHQKQTAGSSFPGNLSSSPDGSRWGSGIRDLPR